MADTIRAFDAFEGRVGEARSAVAGLAFVVGGGVKSGAYGALRSSSALGSVLLEQVAFPTFSVRAKGVLLREAGHRVQDHGSSNTQGCSSIFAGEGKNHGRVGHHRPGLVGGEPA